MAGIGAFYGDPQGNTVFVYPKTNPQLMAPIFLSLKTGRLFWKVLPAVLAIYSVHIIGRR